MKKDKIFEKRNQKKKNKTSNSKTQNLEIGLTSYLVPTMNFAATRPVPPEKNKSSSGGPKKRSPRTRSPRIKKHNLSSPTTKTSPSTSSNLNNSLLTRDSISPRGYASKESESAPPTDDSSVRPLPVSLRPLQGTELRDRPLPARPPPRNNNTNNNTTKKPKSPVEQLGPVQVRLEHRDDGLTTIFDFNGSPNSDSSSTKSLSPTSSGNLRPVRTARSRSPSSSPSTSPNSTGSNNNKTTTNESSLDPLETSRRNRSPPMSLSESKTSAFPPSYSSSTSSSSTSSSTINTKNLNYNSPSSSTSGTTITTSTFPLTSSTSKLGQLPRMPTEDLLNSSSSSSVTSSTGSRKGGRRVMGRSRTPPPLNPMSPMGVSSSGRYDNKQHHQQHQQHQHHSAMDRLEESWPQRKKKSSPLEEVGGRLRQFDGREKQVLVGFGDTTSRKRTQIPVGFGQKNSRNSGVNSSGGSGSRSGGSGGGGGSGGSGSSSLTSLAAMPGLTRIVSKTSPRKMVFDDPLEEYSMLDNV